MCLNFLTLTFPMALTLYVPYFVLGSFSKKLTEHDIVIIIMLYTGIIRYPLVIAVQVPYDLSCLHYSLFCIYLIFGIK